MTKERRSISILFIGNSFSYYHSLPRLIASFAQTSGFGKIIVEGVFRGGATLKILWDEGLAIKKIRSRSWDYVVLQERGRLGGVIKKGVVHVGRPQIFFTYATKFNKEIGKINAKTILYCPPSFLGVGLVDDAKKLNIAYAALARKLRVKMIPSVTAFRLAMKKRPKLDLYESDKHHPNSLGIYLIAGLFYKELFNKKISGLPLWSYSSRSSKLPKNPKRVMITKPEGRFLWSIANSTR